MIVRILGEAQYDVGEADAKALEQLDHSLAAAIESGDEAGYEATLEQMHEMVRSTGTQVSAETIVPSDLTLPHPGSSLSEVRDLLASEETPGD
ncbi:MAG: PspA-associated protein PspAA [Acidimicrobiales bacterium]